MYLKIFISGILMLLLLIFQVAFVSGLPAWLGNINAILVVLIMILGFGSFKTAIWWSLGLGALWDMYSFSAFGLNIIALSSALLLVNFLLENLFTNRSLYTFLTLTMIASLLYETLINLFNLLYSLFIDKSSVFYFSSVFWADELIKVVINMALAFILFYFINFFSKRFKPMFLIR